MIKKIINHSKGVSLPLVVGLVAVLMVASISANEMIIRTLHSANQVESADRAYFAAEGGIEDALYELTAHFAGYETPSLGEKNSRKNNFGENVRWDNNWEIKSISNGNFDGFFTPKQKLVISLFNDVSNPNNITQNQINTESSNINTLNLSDFQIKFKIPYDQEDSYSTAFNGGITINNDKDDELNEDGKADIGNSCGSGSHLTSNDADCDGKENEDSEEDPVVYWKITDDEGNSLTPKPGCFTGTESDDDDPLGTEICEKDFSMNNDRYLSRTLEYSDVGIDQDGTEVTIENFISSTYPGRSANSKLQLELLIVAPLIHTYEDGDSFKKIILPHLEYTVDTPGLTNIPYPKFTIKSDGYYKDFKQSITTTIKPKTTVPLFDFTIIQQQ